MRMIRVLVYVGLAAVLLPSPPEPAGPAGSQAARVGAAGIGAAGIGAAGVGVAGTALPAEDMVSAAVSAADDLSGFCSRQPQACETAHAVLARLEAKARYSFRLLYEWALQPEAEPRPAGAPPDVRADPMPTGSLTQIAAAGVAESQSTLTLEDLIPEWRGPAGTKRT